MRVHSVLQLSSIDSVEKAQALNALGIYTVRDAAEYDGSRHSEHLMAAFTRGMTDQIDLEHYLEAKALTEPNIDALDTLDVRHLLAVSEDEAQTILLYDVLYYFSHPYLGYTGGQDRGYGSRRRSRTPRPGGRRPRSARSPPRRSTTSATTSAASPSTSPPTRPPGAWSSSARARLRSTGPPPRQPTSR